MKRPPLPTHRATVRVPAQLGLHARPSTVIARRVQKSRSVVRIHWSGQSADASSIVEILTLGVPGGSEIEIVATGEDAALTIDALTRLIESTSNYDA